MRHTSCAVGTGVQTGARPIYAAGAILLDLRASGLEGKPHGKAGDEAANAMLCREIRAARPADALLSEEEKDNAARCGQSRVWLVDPLAGPPEYGEGRERKNVGEGKGGTVRVGLGGRRH